MADDILNVIDGKRDALCELLVGIDRPTQAMVQMGIDAVDVAVAEIERLRAAGDRLADRANHAAGCARWDWSGPCDCGLDIALTGWREARRG